MTKAKFEPGHGYDQADWDAVESPPLTDAEMAQAKPFAEAFPELAEKMRKGGRPRSERPKLAVSIRLDQEVVERFKAAGPGWQSRVNDALRHAVGL
ncbi:BrnA antitoxin family protein [uncultured Brevundimonas sp.]|uniref:BrnA antitoxin family protein n=1 Tax=uncultured Brevundimonas sp. TaxID=213418 RepID=UPI0025D7DCEE|nr:BrnA antitoxin family protein [uncultured Brevundimonas sp.]